MESDRINQSLKIPGSVGNVFQIGSFRDLILQLSLASLPAPTITDLFEIIHDPADVPAAIFRTDPGCGSTPYAVPYVLERKGVSDVRSMLYEALLDSGGTLLVQGRAGLGKTREVVQLATHLCADEGWTVYVARAAGDAQLGAPASFSDDLRGSRLLFIFDDLHRRVGSGAAGQTPYPERLEAFLACFDRQLAPGEWYILATARTEPHHQRQLGFDPHHSPWHRFGVYELPEFTEEGLVRMLLGLAQQAGVVVDETEAAHMVADSDHTIRTLVENITLAQRHQRPLTRTHWLNTQGRSWARTRTTVSPNSGFRTTRQREVESACSPAGVIRMTSSLSAATDRGESSNQSPSSWAGSPLQPKYSTDRISLDRTLWIRRRIRGGRIPAGRVRGTVLASSCQDPVEVFRRVPVSARDSYFFAARVRRSVAWL